MKNLFGKKKEEAPPGSPEPQEGNPVKAEGPPQRYRVEEGRIGFPSRVVPGWNPPEPEPAPQREERIFSNSRNSLSTRSSRYFRIFPNPGKMLMGSVLRAEG